jgi:hypothetical protein
MTTSVSAGNAGRNSEVGLAGCSSEVPQQR